MSEVSEQDLELLETYLDGALSSAESEAVRRRLEAQPALLAAVEQLRTERALRQAVWSCAEPDEATSDAVIESVRAATLGYERRTRFVRVLKYATAVAACVVFGFFTGWMGRGRDVSRPHEAVSSALPQAAPSTSGTLHFDGNQQGAYAVTVYDGAGNVMAVQRFNTLDEARQFTQEMNALPVQGGNVKLVDDYQF